MPVLSHLLSSRQDPTHWLAYSYYALQSPDTRLYHQPYAVTGSVSEDPINYRGNVGRPTVSLQWQHWTFVLSAGTAVTRGSKHNPCVRCSKSFTDHLQYRSCTFRPHHEGDWGTLEFCIQRTWNRSLVNNKGIMNLYFLSTPPIEKQKSTLFFFLFH